LLSGAKVPRFQASLFRHFRRFWKSVTLQAARRRDVADLAATSVLPCSATHDRHRLRVVVAGDRAGRSRQETEQLLLALAALLGPCTPRQRVQSGK
jgi:hypothetical protein